MMLHVPVPTTTDELVLQIRHVSKTFGSLRALDDVSFELKKGEFLTMLGPSGSGKTTTLRAIAGFIRPDAGEVWIRGVNVVDTPTYSRNIGMLFQDYALFPHMTVAGNVSYPLEVRKVSRRERVDRVGQILDVVGLGGLEHRYPRQLSGGQQQRVALARALVFNPDLVLLDEPLAALDRQLRASMQLEILRIAKQVGASVISVTHDQEEALVMSDRVAVFDRGALVQIGTPHEIYSAPKTPFVAEFIGDANVLEGALTGTAGRWLVEGRGWRLELPASWNRSSGATPGAVRVVLRPEHLMVGPQIDDAVQVNHCTGTIRQKIYLGVEYRLIVEIAGSQTLQVRSRDMAKLDTLDPGDRVGLSWDASHSIVLPH
jgi:putative spermidine/putrescine transport system ATP-binding protein